MARRIVVYGANSALAAAACDLLASDHILRLTDLGSREQVVAQYKPQKPGAPMLRLFGPPHESCTVDVAEPQQVQEAARGMDAIINCTVVRSDIAGAFRVNVLGCYNIMRAALATGIRRVVQTGPFLTALQLRVGYWHDWRIPDDTPPRVGNQLYGLTKWLGQEICRIFAEEYDLEVPTLLFNRFVNPSYPEANRADFRSLTVSWEDAAFAMRQALHVPSFPHPFEIFHINADLPHGQYPNDKAKSLLKWQPRDRLDSFWMRDKFCPKGGA